MVEITYIEHDGTEHRVQVVPGMSLMQGAVSRGVPGIDAICGGACTCATCHVYVDEAWRAQAGEPSEYERMTLEYADNKAAGSRLACQVVVGEALDGMIVRMPEQQG